VTFKSKLEPINSALRQSETVILILTNHRKALFCQQQQKKGKNKKKQINKNKNNEISENEREERKKIFGLLLAKRMYYGSHKFSVTFFKSKRLIQILVLVFRNNKVIHTYSGNDML